MPQQAGNNPPQDSRGLGKSVVAALDAELKLIARADPALAKSSLAMAARVLAMKLDDSDTSATAAAANARELREHLAEIRARAPSDEQSDEVDELAARAARKLRAV